MSPKSCKCWSKKTLGIAILAIVAFALAAVLVGTVRAAPAAESGKIGLESFCPV